MVEEKKNIDHKGRKRVHFIKWLVVGWGALTLALLGGVASLLRYLFPRVLFEPPQVFKVGLPSEYRLGEVSSRFKDKFNVFLVRTPKGFYALSTTCTHLGCTPAWSDSESKFKCPCHGSGFRKSGVNFEGPAPRPLERYKIFLDDDGQIVVDKTIRFQYEKGQWNHPDSLLVV